MARKAVVTGASLVAVLILSLLRFAIFFPELSTTFIRSLFRLPPSNDVTTKSSFCKSAKNDINNVIPRRIHQMGPQHIDNKQWAQNQQHWINVYQTQLNYEYKYWTDELIEDFILHQYPEALPLYLSYSRNVQRYDMARYLILYHFGGIYADLDLLPLHYTQWLNESLIHSNHNGHPTVIVVAGMGTLSNDLIAAAPRSSLLKFVLSNLEKYDKSWLLPYLTVVASAGPLFFTEQVLQFNRIRAVDDECVQMADYEQFDVHHAKGNSWHEWDAPLIQAIGRLYNRINVVAVVVLFGMVLGGPRTKGKLLMHMYKEKRKSKAS